jgi:hypothetical protein
MLKEFGIEVRQIVVARGVALEWIIDRLVGVVSVALGEDAHAHLIERRAAQRGQRLLFQAVVPMGT